MLSVGSNSLLLACIYKDYDYPRQMDFLQKVSDCFKDRLTVCVPDEHSLKPLMKNLNVIGTPTFLIFRHGKEQARYLGKATWESLLSFVKEFA